jgi:hypothetical protein
VAADLAEDTSPKPSKISRSMTSSLSQPNFFSASELGSNSAKRAPDTRRPHIGKRKSFVGTVCELVSHRPANDMR